MKHPPLYYLRGIHKKQLYKKKFSYNPIMHFLSRMTSIFDRNLLLFKIIFERQQNKTKDTMTIKKIPILTTLAIFFTLTTNSISAFFNLVSPKLWLKLQKNYLKALKN